MKLTVTWTDDIIQDRVDTVYRGRKKYLELTEETVVDREDTEMTDRRKEP